MKVLGTEKVPEHEFVATMPASLLMKMTADPRKTEDEKLRSDDASLQAVYEIRKQVQPEFANSAKAKNVEPYADYICGLLEGRDGITPSIVLWTSQKPTATDSAGSATDTSTAVVGDCLSVMLSAGEFFLCSEPTDSRRGAP